MAQGRLTDEEIAKLEASQAPAPGRLTDEQITAMEARPSGVDNAVAAAPAGGYEKSKLDRLVEALKGAPDMLNQARTSLMTAPINLALNPSEELGPKGGLGSVIRGEGQGFSYGFAPKLRGVDGALEEGLSRINPLESKGLGPQGTRPSQSLSDALAGRYNEDKKNAERENDVSAQTQPGLFYGSQALASVATPNPFGKLAALNTGSKLVNAGGRIGSAAGQGALYTAGIERGGTLDDYLNSVPKGALVGGALGAGGELVSAAAPRLETMADKMAVNVAAGGKGQIGDKLKKIGLDNEADRLDFGKQLLDKGMIPSGFNPMKRPVESVAERAAAMGEREGATAGNIVRDVNATGFKVDPAKYQSLMRSKLGRAPDEVANQSKANELIGWAGDIKPSGADPALGGITGMQGLKSRSYNSANFSDTAKLEPLQHRMAISGLRQGIEEDVGSVFGPQAKNQLVESNRNYGFAMDAKALAEPAASRAEAGGVFLPVKNAILAGGFGAGGGAAIGHTGMGGALGVGTSLLGHVAATRGPAMLATGGRIGANAANAVGASGLMSKGAVPSILDKYLNNDTGDGGDDPLKAMPEEERVAKGAKHFTSNTGGGR